MRLRFALEGIRSHPGASATGRRAIYHPRNRARPTTAAAAKEMRTNSEAHSYGRLGTGLTWALVRPRSGTTLRRHDRGVARYVDPLL